MEKSDILSQEPIPRSKINKENIEWLKETYWNSVRYADTLTGMLVDRLKDIGIYDNTIVIISADHGNLYLMMVFLAMGILLINSN